MKSSLIVFDLEATCEDRNLVRNFDNEIIEIGAVKLVNGEIVDEFQIFVKPTKNKTLTNFCKKLTSIKQEDVDNGYSYPEAIDKFKLWSEGFTLCSWGLYDRKQLEKDNRRYGLDTEWISNHRNLKAEHGVLKGLKKPVGVGRALNMAGLKFIGVQHRGIDDAKNIARIYLNEF